MLKIAFPTLLQRGQTQMAFFNTLAYDLVIYGETEINK